MAKKVILGTDIARDAFKTKINDNFTELYNKDVALEQSLNDLDAEIDNHKIEVTQQAIRVSRDLSILGTQTIATVAGRKIKSIKMVGVIATTKNKSEIIVDEVGNSFSNYFDITNGLVYTGTTFIFSANATADRTGTGITLNIGSIALNWVKISGNGVTGTAILDILVTYHD